MAAFPQELHHTSSDFLLQLLDHYYVRTHYGESYQGPAQFDAIMTFIAQWLTPEIPTNKSINVVDAIQQGIPFQSNDETIIDQIFEDRIPVSTEIINDFAKYPIRKAFNYDPWDLLLGYVRADDRNQYFENITGQSSNNFLNHTERIFYLTRGYGRPNKFISHLDFELRNFFIQASPTALIALSDIFGICPTRQDPDFILEKLSGTNLRTIDKFHRDTVAAITKCLGYGNICTTQNYNVLQFPYEQVGNFDVSGSLPTSDSMSCDQSKVTCFREFLKTIGALPIFEYDPANNVFISNISQLDEYKNVIPTKEWSLQEYQDLPDVLVIANLQKLPDLELLNITSYGFRYVDQVDLTQLNTRLRSRLVAGAIQFLTKPHFFIQSDQLYYGRLIDSNINPIVIDDLIENIDNHGALIDANGHVIDINTAEDLYNRYGSETFRQAIIKTQARAIENVNLLTTISPEQKERLRKGFQSIINLNYDDNINIDDLNLMIKGPFRRLILWSNENDWDAIAINFEEYFKYWAPLYPQIIKDTINYYIQTL